MSELDEMREKLAAEAHLVWQRWMGYMLTHLDDEHIERWKRQANTAYHDLPEDERNSDRAIADQYLECQTKTLRITVVRKEGELSNPWAGKEKSIETVRQPEYQVYKQCQRDILSAGFVQEVKDGH